MLWLHSLSYNNRFENPIFSGSRPVNPSGGPSDVILWRRYPLFVLTISRDTRLDYFSRNSKESLFFLSFRALTKKNGKKKKKTEINNLLEHFVLPSADACRRMRELARATSSTSNKVFFFVLTSPAHSPVCDVLRSFFVLRTTNTTSLLEYM